MIQALDVIRLFQNQNAFPIARAQMRLRLSMTSKDGKRVREHLTREGLLATIENQDIDNDSFKLVSWCIQKRHRLLA
jgi:ribosome maturation protein SDO1